MRLTATIYPNRELRVVMHPERRSAPLPEDSPPEVLSLQTPVGDIIPGFEAVTESEVGEATAPPLTLHPNSEPPGPKPGFGVMGRETKFGTTARRQLLRCGGVFDLERIPPGEVLFLTGTLPGGTMDAMVAIAANSSRLVDSLKSWIAKNETNTYALYVWERQKRGALHLHYAVHIKDPLGRARILGGFKRWWFNALTRIAADSSVDLFEWANRKGSWRDRPDVVQADAQECFKSPSSYLAKYASKGSGKEAARANEDGEVMPWPVRWWGCSRPLLAACRRYTETVSCEGLSLAEQATKKEQIYELFATNFSNIRERDTVNTLGGDGESVEVAGSTWHSYTDLAQSSRVWVGFGPQFRDVWNRVVPCVVKPRRSYESLDRNEGVSVEQVRSDVDSGAGHLHHPDNLVPVPTGNSAGRNRKHSRVSISPGQLSTGVVVDQGPGTGSRGSGRKRTAFGLDSLRHLRDGRTSQRASGVSDGLLRLGTYWTVSRRVCVRTVPSPAQYLEAERIRLHSAWTWCTMAASRH